MRVGPEQSHKEILTLTFFQVTPPGKTDVSFAGTQLDIAEDLWHLNVVAWRIT